MAKLMRRLFKHSCLYSGVEQCGVTVYLPVPLASCLCLASVSPPLHRDLPVSLALHGQSTWQGNFQVWEVSDSPEVTQLVAEEEPEPNPTGSKFCAHCVLNQKGQLEMLKYGKNQNLM